MSDHNTSSGQLKRHSSIEYKEIMEQLSPIFRELSSQDSFNVSILLIVFLIEIHIKDSMHLTVAKGVANALVANFEAGNSLKAGEA